MTPDRRPWGRPYFFEVLAVANLAAIAIAASRVNVSILGSLPGTLLQFLPTLLGYALVGIVVRAAVSAYRKELPAFIRVICRAGWITDTLRLALFGALTMHAYFWIKLLVPVMHPRLFDQELWNIDQAMMGGLSPNVLFINIFSSPVAMRAIDWTYARVFFASMTIAFAFFLSAPSRRVRIAFTTGNTTMWLAGAWLYMLLPSLGPAYRFPDLWLPLREMLPLTHHFQTLLMRNYQNVLRLVGGTPSSSVQLAFGIAAFPSLHVAFQTFAFLWMRRVWGYGEIVFGVFTLLIAIGSVVTGWHYLIDAVAGVALAAGSYWLGTRLWHVPRWRRLRVSESRVAVSDGPQNLR